MQNLAFLDFIGKLYGQDSHNFILIVILSIVLLIVITKTLNLWDYFSKMKSQVYLLEKKRLELEILKLQKELDVKNEETIEQYELKYTKPKHVKVVKGRGCF